jgi:hypothetical protein
MLKGSCQSRLFNGNLPKPLRVTREGAQPTLLQKSHHGRQIIPFTNLCFVPMSNRPVAGSFAVLLFPQKNRFPASAFGKSTRFAFSFWCNSLEFAGAMLLLENEGSLLGEKVPPPFRKA